MRRKNGRELRRITKLLLGFGLSLLCLTLTPVLAAQDLRTGDLVFQSEPGNFAKAIQLATKSPYNHVGMVFLQNGKPYVFEAVGPVQYTSLERFAARGIDGKYTVMRLKDADQVLNPKVLEKMGVLAKKFEGRPYSQTFDWLDEKMYCSELVWKMYQRTTGLEIGKLEPFKNFDLSHPLVKSEIIKRFGGSVPPGLKVVSPASMQRSSRLTLVAEN